MKILVFLLVLVVQIKANAQTTIPKTFVWAKKGLVLRDSPEKSGNKITTIPYGSEVEILQIAGGPLFDSVTIIPSLPLPDIGFSPKFMLRDYWQKVTFGGLTGYVFGAYLSSMTPYKPLASGENYGISGYLSQTVGLLDSIEIGYNHNFRRVYKNHTVLSTHFGEGGGRVRCVFQDGLSFNDGFLLFNYFNPIEEILKPSSGSLEILLLKCVVSENNLEVLIEGSQMANGYYFSIQYIDGLLIIVEGSWC